MPDNYIMKVVLFNLLTGDPKMYGWIIPIGILMLLLINGNKQDRVVNEEYDIRQIDEKDLAAVYGNQSRNLRELQLVWIKVYLSGILLVLSFMLVRVW